MTIHSTREILEAVREGSLAISKAEKLLKVDSLAIVGDIARLDLGRGLRRGVPEIVYAESKSLEQMREIIKRLVLVRKNSDTIDSPIIVSRLRPEQRRLLTQLFRQKRRGKGDRLGKGNVIGSKLELYPKARLAIIRAMRSDPGKLGEKVSSDAGRVALIAAGTSDIPALTEARVICEAMGCRTIEFNDMGVASLARLQKPMVEIAEFDPDVLIVAAGMEAALPSVISSLSSVPVVGLPTSVGYGYGGKGEAALMSMLQACPLGICVVNIDGGAAAGVIASLIANRCGEMRRTRKS